MLPTVIGIVLMLGVGIAIAFAYQQARNTDNVMAAATDLAAFSFVDKEDLEVLAVPKASITDNDLTESEYDELYGDGGMVLTGLSLQGQRIDTREVASGPQESFSVVLSDERVVAATTTLSGAAVGTIQAGDVVDIASEGGSLDGGVLSDYAKVICIASTAAGCSGVLPPGVDLTAAGDEDTGEINLLLAVEGQSANSISGQQVSLSLNPFCRVDRSGYFYSPRGSEGASCDAPNSREAARNPAGDDATSSETTPPETPPEG